MAGEEVGLAAELLKRAPDDVPIILLLLLSDMLYTAGFPRAWPQKKLYHNVAQNDRRQGGQRFPAYSVGRAAVGDTELHDFEAN